MSTPATLIYNANSGGAKRVGVDKLIDLLGEQGFSPVYRATSKEEDLDPILEDAEGLVVAVGGDGTLRAVATRLVDKNVALALIPLGTANNVARTLGLQGKPKKIIEGLSNPRKVRFDLGHVRSPYGEDYFLEAVGCGLFADILYRYDPEAGKSVLRAVETLQDVVVGYKPRRWQAKLDGNEVSGTYIGIEVLNTSATGPRLQLAPDADPSDGLFDVVFVQPPEGPQLLEYVTGLLNGTFDEVENVTVLRGKRLTIQSDGAPIHLDAELRPDPRERAADAEPAKGARPQPQTTSDGLIEVTLMPGALELWLPPKED